jgi:hypothetical protein
MSPMGPVAAMSVMDPDHAPLRADEEDSLRLADDDHPPRTRDVAEWLAANDNSSGTRDEDGPLGTMNDDDSPGTRYVAERPGTADEGGPLWPADQDDVRRPLDEDRAPRAYEGAARPSGAVHDDLPAGATYGISAVMRLTVRRQNEADPECHRRDPWDPSLQKSHRTSSSPSSDVPARCPTQRARSRDPLGPSKRSFPAARP